MLFIKQDIEPILDISRRVNSSNLQFDAKAIQVKGFVKLLCYTHV